MVTMRNKLASQANLCYNKPTKLLWLSDVATILSREFHLSERRTMNSLPPHAHEGNTPEKKCTGPCGRTLPATPQFFHAAQKGKYGLAAKCKDCRSKQAEEYISRPEVKDHRKEYHSNPEIKAHRRDYLNQPEVRENERTRDRVYRSLPERRKRKRIQDQNYRSRPEVHQRLIVKKRAYHSRIDIRERRHIRDSQPAMREKRSSYRKLPYVREYERTHYQNRRALKRNAFGKHTAQQIREQYERQKGICYYCRDKVKWGEHHIEHVVPLSRGGSNDIDNIVIACSPCNLSKHNKLPHEWFRGGRLL